MAGDQTIPSRSTPTQSQINPFLHERRRPIIDQYLDRYGGMSLPKPDDQVSKRLFGKGRWH